MHLHDLPGRPHPPRTLTVCAMVGAAALTAPNATAPDPPPHAVTTASTSAASAGAEFASLPVTDTNTSTVKKKRKKLRFARRSEAIVSIRSVRISRFVYRGAQRTIDRGRVAHFTGWPETFTHPGRAGVYWLAAHNYGRSGPFHRLLKVKKGARIVVRTRSGHRYVYKVHRLRVVDTNIRKSVVWGAWGPREGPSRAVLQTCTGSKRLLVFARLVQRA